MKTSSRYLLNAAASLAVFAGGADGMSAGDTEPRLSSTSSKIQKISATGQSNGNTALPAPRPETLLSEDGKAEYPIDLPTALQLADAQNPQVAFARERIQQAMAQSQAAGVLWVPTLRGGVTGALHDGSLQETRGQVVETDRNSLQVGSGAAAFGAGPPMLPGLAADFHIADAIFQPLAARRAVAARQAGSVAETNNVLLDVARAYLELQRSYADIAIAAEARANTKLLAELTEAYAKSGQGLQADADRAQAEADLRINDVTRSKEGVFIASSRLVRQLHLDPLLLLRPLDSQVAPLEMTPHAAPLADQVAVAHANRPELIENDHLIGEASARLKREQYAPLVPTISMGMSYGGFGGSGSSSDYHFSDRTDFQAMAYWQLRNLGLGDRAAQRDRRSQVRQACLRKQVLRDIVAQEVAEAHAQLRFRYEQIKTAEHAVTVAIASYERNLDRIKGAQGLPIEVLQAIQALAQARREYVRTVIDYNIAQFSMQRAVGTFLLQPTATE